MEELVKEIKDAMEVLGTNLEENLKGNKAAGLRARKSTLKLEKLFKEYRKQSVENDRK